MTAIVVVGAIAVIGAVVARVTWRRPADERHSIQSHQQTLETLRAMADRRSTLRAGSAGSAPASSAGGSTRPPGARSGPRHGAPVRSGEVRADTARPGSVRAPVSPTPGSNGHNELVFVDDGAAAPASGKLAGPRISGLAFSKGLSRSGRGHALGRRHRSRQRARAASVVGAVVLLVVVVGLAVALAPSPHAKPSAHRGTGPKTAVRSGRSDTTVATIPQVRPTSSTSSTAAYAAPPTGYTLALQATGPCWVEASDPSTGHVVWTGTLTAGQTQSIPATGSLIVRLGAADDVIVTLNGQQVLLPPGFQSPFDMSFDST